MSSQSGQNYVISYKPQVTIGTPVTGSSGVTLRTLASTGFSLDRVQIQSEELRPDGLYGAPRKGVKSCPGSYTCEYSYGTFDPIFEAFLRSTFSVGVLNAGSTRSFLTFDQYHSDVDLSLQVETVRVLSCGLEVPAEGMVRLNIGLMGRNAVGLASGSSPGLTSPSLTSTEPMAGIDSVITAPGSAKFTACSFTATRSGGVQGVIGDTLSPDVYDGNARCTGSLSGTLETMAWLAAVGAESSTTITVLVTDAAGNTTQFDLANAQLMNFKAPVGQANAMIVSSDFSWGGAASFTITNTDA